jgi:hypothetical protein
VTAFATGAAGADVAAGALVGAGAGAGVAAGAQAARLTTTINRSTAEIFDVLRANMIFLLQMNFVNGTPLGFGVRVKFDVTIDSMVGS